MKLHSLISSSSSFPSSNKWFLYDSGVTKIKDRVYFVKSVCDSSFIYKFSFVCGCVLRAWRRKSLFRVVLQYDEKDRIVMREGSHRYEIKKVKVLYRCTVTTRHIMTPPPHLPRSRLCRYFAIIISLGQATNE